MVLPPPPFHEELSFAWKQWLYEVYKTLDTSYYTLADDATPSVKQGTNFLTGGTTTITNFDDGVPGKTIRVISEHAITITDGTNIFLSGSTNYVMGATDTLTLVQKEDGKWYELARSNN